MGWRFRRSIRLGKGLRLNISKRGLGLSAGVRGFHVGVGPRGPYASAGIPGTGLYVQEQLGKGHARRPHSQSQSQTAAGQGTPSQHLQVHQPVSLPGDGSIGCGAVLLICGGLLALVSPAVGLTILGVGFLLAIVGSQNPERGRAKQGRVVRAKIEEAGQAEERGAHEEALRLLSEALAQQPANASLHYLQGHVLHNAGRYPEAVTALEQARQLGASEPEVPLLLGRCDYEVGQGERAIKVLQQVPDDSPYHVAALVTMAEIMLAQGHPAEAIEVLQRAPLRKRNLDAALLEAHYCLGTAYAATGKKQSALRHFRRVYAQDAGYRDVKEQMAKLGENV